MNKEIEGEAALRKLIEIKDKKIWDMNLEIGKMTSELVNLRGAQQIVRKLDAEKQDYISTIKSLETALANALAEDQKQKEADELMMKKLEEIQDLENELALVKSTTVDNSPEMRDAKARIKELGAINESHQELNGNLRREITALEQEKLELHIDNKKLADQIQDQVERARKAGM